MTQTTKYVCIHTQTRTYIHAYIHTYIHAHTRSLACVKVIGNPLPIAIGTVLFDPGSVNVDEGRVMQVRDSHDVYAYVEIYACIEAGSINVNEGRIKEICHRHMHEACVQTHEVVYTPCHVIDTHTYI